MDEINKIEREVEILTQRIGRLEELRAEDRVLLERAYNTLLDVSKESVEAQRFSSEMLVRIYETLAELGEKISKNRELGAANSLKIDNVLQWRDEIARVKPKRKRAVDATQVGETHLSMAANALASSFNETDLIGLMFDLGIPDNEIAGDTHKLRCINVIKWVKSRGIFWDTVQVLKKERPKSIWPVDTGPLDPSVLNS